MRPTITLWSNISWQFASLTSPSIWYSLLLNNTILRWVAVSVNLFLVIVKMYADMQILVYFSISKLLVWSTMKAWIISVLYQLLVNSRTKFRILMTTICNDTKEQKTICYKSRFYYNTDTTVFRTDCLGYINIYRMLFAHDVDAFL